MVEIDIFFIVLFLMLLIFLVAFIIHKNGSLLLGSKRLEHGCRVLGPSLSSFPLGDSMSQSQLKQNILDVHLRLFGTTILKEWTSQLFGSLNWITSFSHIFSGIHQIVCSNTTREHNSLYPYIVMHC